MTVFDDVSVATLVAQTAATFIVVVVATVLAVRSNRKQVRRLEALIDMSVTRIVVAVKPKPAPAKRAPAKRAPAAKPAAKPK